MLHTGTENFVQYYITSLKNEYSRDNNFINKYDWNSKNDRFYDSITYNQFFNLLFIV